MNRAARLDRSVLLRASLKLGAELTLLLVVLLLSLVVVMATLRDGVVLPELPLLVLGLLGASVAARRLAPALRDRYDLLALHYLLLGKEFEVAADHVRRRPWRDAIESALRR